MRELLPVLIVLLAVLLVALAAAVGVVVWMSEDMGSVLVYQIVTPSDVAVGAVVAAIDGRLNPSWPGMARVRPLDASRIEVVVLGKDPRHVQRVERLLEHRGHLQLRIVANRRDHKSLFEQADPENVQAVHNEAGDLLARWVPVAKGRESNCGSETRTIDRDGRKVLQLLLLEDQIEVTDEHIQRIWAHVDKKGKPCARFELNETGSRLLEKLTKDYLPDPFDPTDVHRMAVVLDGRVWSCFPIQDTIRIWGQIPGGTSEEELRDLIDILQSDPLPASVRQIEKRSSAAER